MERIILIKEKKTENQATTNEVTWLNRYNIIIDKQNGKKRIYANANIIKASRFYGNFAISRVS